MDKLVSVNITTYNRANFLPRCLDSILAQSYKNIEVVVVDDCSQDNTALVMENYLKRDGRIKYYKHEKNLGNAHARNTALANCRGYYVAFMDDDDEWIDPDKLKKQVNIFENQHKLNLGIVCSGVQLVDADGNVTIKQEHKPSNLQSVLLKGNGLIHNSTVMTTREIMQEVGGFDIKMPRGVDSEFFRTVVVQFKYDIHIMPDITAAYYAHGEERMTTDKKNAVYKTLFANYHVLGKHFVSYLKYPDALIHRLFTRSKKILSYYISR